MKALFSFLCLCVIGYDNDEKESEDRHSRKANRITPTTELEQDKSFTPVEVKPSSSGDVSSLSTVETK